MRSGSDFLFWQAKSSNNKQKVMANNCFMVGKRIEQSKYNQNGGVKTSYGVADMKENG
jgi:hypothetical protein